MKPITDCRLLIILYFRWCQASAFCQCAERFAAAERRILALTDHLTIDQNLLVYINRLSDYLFVLSRRINFPEKKTKYFGIIVANEVFYYTFAENIKKRNNIHILNTVKLCIDVGISIKNWKMHLPTATKDELIDYAMRSGAPLEVIETFRKWRMRVKFYESIEDIWV